ncbi:hypothetical protein P3X46_005451 [Hevea brasiliensis]|uniref:peptidylprolyl isomerase n=1 Tax=Hevea brasiliensis TaxID=3981 RepID=A0ABQ9MZZ1_HEVBR|nr:hypothetical protein P3X46_005451 [Hevea brasiliensis]
MEGLPLHTLFHFPPVLQSPSKRWRDAMTMDFYGQFAPLTVKSLPRRGLLKAIGFNTVLSCVSPVFAAPMPEVKEPQVFVYRTLKLDSGVRIQDIIEGEGQKAQEGDLVEVNYVCRRSNGYFVHSTVDQFSGESSPVILPLDENQVCRKFLFLLKIRFSFKDNWFTFWCISLPNAGSI